MAITQRMNSKGNIKRFTGADLPSNPRLPVIARMAPVESTANQTVINLPWSVDTLNAQDSFFISIDGKVLSIGSAYDYTMSAVDNLGFSSQVTLTSPILGGLNIQAWKLGLKKESEFAQDARFANTYEALDQGFQAFVRTSDLMVATAAAGSPVAGTFYSTISNRASLPDMLLDLKPRMGVDRIMTQQLYPIQGEVGPNGEPVLGAVNDSAGILRFVGTSWTNIVNLNGSVIFTTVVGDYVEITFYGTGLNGLFYLNAANRVASVSVDGGSATNVTMCTTSTSAAINGRSYTPNTPINLVSGLAPGVHTVKVALGSGAELTPYGFEILNESILVRTNPGIGYNQGKKIITSATDLSSYTAGVSGTKGARVLVYQASDGSIGRNVTLVNASQLNLASADHTNEEISRTITPREFSSSQSTDWSVSANGAKAGVLDDGTTALVTDAAIIEVGPNSREIVRTSNSGNFITIDFVGTGLDIETSGDGVTRAFSVTVDNVNVGSSQVTLSRTGVVKLVSGLPYGSHSVKLIATTASVSGIYLTKILVYQPKKPTLPSGAVELGDFNVVGNYTANATAGTTTIASGVLRKFATREMNYTGTWSVGTSADIGGLTVNTSTTSDFLEYTFTGTGFEWRGGVGGAVMTLTVAVNGSNNLAALPGTPVTSFYGGFASFVAATGVATTTGVSTTASGLRVSGLTYGKYTVRITRGASAALWAHAAFDVIVPIHSVRSNSPADILNSLAVGSQSIADNRKLTPVKTATSSEKYRGIARGITSNPTNASSVLVPIPDMQLTVLSKGAWFDFEAYILASINTAANWQFEWFINGLPLENNGIVGPNSLVVGQEVGATLVDLVYLGAGTHKVELYARVSGGTGTFTGIKRKMFIKEN